jgi:uncharacterized protein YycO
MRVAGLAPVQVPTIENVNVTELVPGHMAYRAAKSKTQILKTTRSANANSSTKSKKLAKSWKRKQRKRRRRVAN